MKITIETGGDPNPRVVAFKTFLRRNKKRIIAGGVLLVVLLATVWACSGIRESQRKSEEWTRMHNYWECRREEPASYSFSHVCAKYNPDSPDYDPKATYTRTPTATP
ncbi:hypothetical protein [Tsukamurella strandjordii]|uniref:Uncharacterized protein n=1 Tax=Tsukamurella strandjordii TaxID=147577 RepID=A0AA90NEC1_9ACTN|nr:hypothetical protein [Tsukamurella strandjordii]MDP0400390.1 hypothetical protein [Tsukamurella strandjordii]